MVRYFRFILSIAVLSHVFPSLHGQSDKWQDYILTPPSKQCFAVGVHESHGEVKNQDAPEGTTGRIGIPKDIAGSKIKVKVNSRKRELDSENESYFYIENLSAGTYTIEVFIQNEVLP
ncbi:MAG: hypothetical protein GY790_00395 [Bacteroidetes bacterium]|nr:hypothetical protein [Bacteroidota bacterium]